jgi:transcriptional regulator with XRE-family HTH domain
MKLSDLKSIDQVITEDLASDAAFAEEWDRTAFARQVAITIVRYRAERGLSQRQLAAMTGLQQPAIARLEIGEGTPSLATLAKLSRATGLEFHLEIAQGDVVIPAVRRSKPQSEYRVKRSFDVRHHDGGTLSKAQLADQQALLSAEMAALEECNEEMRSPAVTFDAKGGSVSVEMLLLSSTELDALETALFICRTAIHAIGGSTPHWPKPRGVEPQADFKPAGLFVEAA